VTVGVLAHGAERIEPVSDWLALAAAGRRA